MIQDYTVNTEFLNRQTGEKVERVFPLTTYCNNISFELKKVLYEIENVFFHLEGHKDRQEWSEFSQESFNEIRRKLLNDINGVARLPDSMHYKGVSCKNVPMSEVIASMLDNK